MKQAITHPDPATLRAFALGQLDPEALGPLEEHIAGCAACAAALAGVPDDTLLGKLRENATVGMAASDTLGGTDDVPPELLNHPRYVVTRKLGSGGMGTVFQAVHRLMEREVALKVIATRLTSHPIAVQRFAQEVKAAGRLTHPNIVAAHDAEQCGELFFLVMEYVEGISLDRLVAKKGPVPVEQAVHFIRQAALGLQHAHEQGMVHRDVKPQNLMVTRKGQVKVLDFGLVRVAEETARPSDGRPLTMLGTVLGTPDYIAPEQVGDSRHVDIRADIYSLGCTLYFLLAGQPPFPEGSAIEKALSHVDQPPVPLRSLRPDVPAELLAVLDRMMAKKPAERFQTPGEVAQALAAIQKPTSQVVEAVEVLPDPPPPPKKKTPRVSDTVEVLPDPPPVPKKKKRRKAGRGGFPLWFGAVLSVVALAAVAVGLIAFGFGKRPTQGEPNVSPNVAPVLPPAKARLPRVLVVLPHQGFWHPDYEGLRAGLEGKAELVVASSALTPAKPHPEGGGEAVRPTLTLFQAEAADFDAVVFSGGRGRLEYAFDRPFKQQAGEFMERMLASGKVVGGLCMGVAVLASAGVLDGKRATGYPDISDKLTKLGVKYQNQAVEVDGNLITGRDPEAARPFAGRLLKEIDQRAK